LIEAAVDAVGNELQLNGVSLMVADQSTMLKSALAAAMSDASVKAQDYAQISGHHVGGLVRISEVVSSTGGPCMGCGGAKGGGGGGIPIQAGQTSVTVTVAVTYELVS
jgi:uncharacterized protein YggE